MVHRLYSGFPDFPLFQSQYLAGQIALFLDVDGTLVEIARRPDAVRVTEPLRELLGALLHDNAGAVALVSGRTLAGLDELFAPVAFPAAGLHGAQRRSARGIIHTQVDGAGLRSVREFLSENSCEGLLVEDKGAAIVLHYREQPHLAERAHELAHRAVKLAGNAWEAVPGKMLIEIRAARLGKGHALADFMNEPPFAGRIPAFLGDDVTDEDGFEFVNRNAGWSVHVGTGPTCAHRTLPDPLAVWRLLRALHPRGIAEHASA
jgi:trehalose 6-phosphate phosphatase